MKQILQSTAIMLLLAINFSFNSISKVRQINALNGIWLPVKQEFAGTQWPATVFEKQRLIISNNNYTVMAESIDKGEIKYADGKMDIYGKEGANAGMHYTAVYKLENGQLIICYNLSGNGYPEGFETKVKTMLFMVVYKKGEK